MNEQLSSFYLPTVIEHTRGGERAYDIYSRLLMDRIVFLGTQVNDTVANAIIAQLLFLESQDPEKDIYLYINSPGGVITAGMAIYDTMQYIRPDVATICMGQAASMGALLLGGQLMSIGFLAELFTSFYGRDDDAYSVKQRIGAEDAPPPPRMRSSA